MIRAFSRWTNKNPLAAVILGSAACIALMYIAHAWDESESRGVRVAANFRSST